MKLRRRVQVRSSIRKDTTNSGGQSAEGGSRRLGQQNQQQCIFRQIALPLRSKVLLADFSWHSPRRGLIHSALG